MKRSILYIPGLILSLMVLFTACSEDLSEYYSVEDFRTLSKNLELPTVPYNYAVKLKPPFSLDIIAPTTSAHNRTRNRDDVATLGRVLFYDKALSKNYTLSCGSCHKPEFGFAEAERFSKGFEGKLTTRNSLPLGNVVSFESSYGTSNPGTQTAKFAWDDNTSNIKRQSMLAVTSPIEMGLKREELVHRVNEQEMYAVLARKAFGLSELSELSIYTALEVFVNSISASHSRFDQQLDATGFRMTYPAEGDEIPVINGFEEIEQNGMELFNRNCASCHSTFHKLVAQSAGNNGLDEEYADKGKSLFTKLDKHDGVFKIPFLRNIALSGPYMHDGRFATLEEVIDFYSEGIQPHKNLDEKLRNEDGTPKRFQFTPAEREALMSYLHTLTDEKSMMLEKYSDPFLN